MAGFLTYDLRFPEKERLLKAKFLIRKSFNGIMLFSSSITVMAVASGFHRASQFSYASISTILRIFNYYILYSLFSSMSIANELKHNKKLRAAFSVKAVLRKMNR